MFQDKYTVLLADDSPDDRLFLKKAIERSSKLIVIGEACDGQETVDYLKGEGIFGDRIKYPLPNLLLLDIKMPIKNGYDVLEWRKASFSHPMIVIMISGSWLQEDLAKSFSLGASGYFQKSSLRKEQDEMLRGIEELLEKQISDLSKCL